MKNILVSISFLFIICNCFAQGNTQEEINSLTKGVSKSSSKAGYIGSSENKPDVNNSFYSEGISYSLAKRIGTVLPDPLYNIQEEGIVVILIRVNQEGNIVNAQVRLKGTNTSSPVLIKAALEAAKRSAFNIDMNAAKEQVGFITYRFSLEK